MASEIIAFLGHHWVLVTLFVLVMVAIVIVEAVNHALSPKSLDPQSVVNLMNHEEAIVIDLRNRGQFKSSHIINAKNIPYHELDKSLDKIIAHKEKPIILVCANGQEAVNAAKKLAEQGLKSVRQLAGGIQAWKSAGFPLEK